MGASLAAVDPRLALLVNAATFGVSALLMRFGVRERTPSLDRRQRSNLLRETVDGFRLVFPTPALRALIALLVFCGVCSRWCPEGLGAAWAADLADELNGGWAQA